MLTSASEKAMEIVTKQTPAATDPAAQLNALLKCREDSCGSARATKQRIGRAGAVPRSDVESGDGENW